MFEAYNYLEYLLRTNNKSFSHFKWTANAFILFGAVAIALSVKFSQQAWPFIINLVGTVMWFWAATLRKETELAWYQGFFIAINVYAIALRSFT